MPRLANASNAEYLLISISTRSVAKRNPYAHIPSHDLLYGGLVTCSDTVHVFVRTSAQSGARRLCGLLMMIEQSLYFFYHLDSSSTYYTSSFRSCRVCAGHIDVALFCAHV
jgi:hypothetical protein